MAQQLDEPPDPLLDDELLDEESPDDELLSLDEEDAASASDVSNKK